MSDKHILKTTVVVKGDILTPQVTAITEAEKVSENSEKYFIFSYLKISYDAGGMIAGGATAYTDRIYLEGKIENLDQVIKIEVPQEALDSKEFIDSFHSLMVLYSEAYSREIVFNAMKKMFTG